MGRENDDELAGSAESRGLGAIESPSEAIEVWDEEHAAPPVTLTLFYDSSTAARKWSTWLGIAAAIGLVGYMARRSESGR